MSDEGEKIVCPGSEALRRLLAYGDVKRVLDVGSGEGTQARIMREAGRTVTTVSLKEPADVIGDFITVDLPDAPYDAIWACYVLEHMRNPGQFLDRCFALLRDHGVLAITVPPLKYAVVGGHVSLWCAGTLVYHLVLAGFDCALARVSRVYSSGPQDKPYNISVVVRKVRAELPTDLACDCGDIEKLAQFFPVPIKHGGEGRFHANWGWDP